MSNLVEVKIPDIGDFKEVAVIDVLVKPGDRLKAEDSLITRVRQGDDGCAIAVRRHRQGREGEGR